METSKSCFKFIQVKDFGAASVRIFYYSQNVVELPLELTLALNFSLVIFYSVLDRMLPWLNFLFIGALHQEKAMYIHWRDKILIALKYKYH